MILEHYFQLVRHYRKLLVAIVASFTLVTAVFSEALLLVFPLYTATSSVVMLPTEAELMFTKGWLQQSQFNPANMLTQTHQEYLLSRPVIERTLEKMRTGGDEEGEAKPWWKQALAKAIGGTKGFARRTYMRLNYGKFVPVSRHEEAVGMLMEGIELEVVEGSYILQISVTLPYPGAAAKAANALADAYVERMTEQTNEKADLLEDFLQRQIALRENKLDELADREFKMREELGLLSLEEDRQYLMTARETESEKLTETRIKKAELQAGLKVIKRQKGEARIARIYGELEQQITEAEQRLEELSVREEIQQETMDTLSKQLNSLVEKEKPLLVMARQQDQLEAELDDFRKELVTVNLSKSNHLSQLRNINPAQVPVYPSFPKVLIYTGIAAGAGLLVAAFLLVLIDTTSGTVKTTPDLRRLAGERALGLVQRRLLDVVAGRRPLSARADAQLQDLGKDLERQMAALGAFDTPAIQVTGFAERQDVSDATVTIAAALAEHGAEVMCRLPKSTPAPPTLDHIGQGRLQVTHNGLPSDSPRTVQVECVGPMSANFRWSRVKARSSSMVCVLPAGDLTEDAVEEFQSKALESGLSGVAFVLLDR